MRGVTSNPTIFEKAIAGGDDYDARRSAALAPRSRRRRRGGSSRRWRSRTSAARPTCCAGVYDETGGGDGFVSLEVSPDLAHDTAGTVAEARRLWAAVGAPQPDDQGAGHGGGRAGDRAADRRGHQRQRHAAVRASTPTSGWPRRTSTALERRLARGEAIDRVALGGELLRQPHRHGGRPPARRASCSAATAPRAAALERLRGKRRDRQRQARLPALPGDRSPRRAGAALAARGARPQRLLWAAPAPRTPPTATCSTSRS